MRISATCDWSILFASLSSARVGAVRLGHARHVDGLRVVGDHALHELDVGNRIDGAFGDRDMVVPAHPGHVVLLCLHGCGPGEQQGEDGERGSGDSGDGEAFTICGAAVRLDWGDHMTGDTLLHLHGVVRRDEADKNRADYFRQIGPLRQET